MKREKLSSRLGFILLSAGCAIGIGNVWKFPYIVGENGGGIFLLFYLLFLVLLGIPVMTMEFSMGRAAKKSIAALYQKLTPDKKAWQIHGKLALAGNVLLMMFYTTVAGWMLRYFVDCAAGAFVGIDAAGAAAHFERVNASWQGLILCMGIVVFAGFGICAIGLANGLEKITKWMMLALLALMAVLAINSLFLPGAVEGLKFFFLPDFQRVHQIGLGSVIVQAMNQSFFSLSVGMGGMAVFGSYIDDKHTLFKEACHVSILDTVVAITAGLIIIPSCFAYQVEVTAGPSLIFITLPNIFASMPMGRLCGSLFFIFMSFAAFSTVLAVFENIISSCMDLWGGSRKKTCLILSFVIFVLSIPCALGFNLLAGIEPLKAGSTILDFEDFLVSGILMPLGSLVIVLYCTWSFGWGWDSFIQEANLGKGIRFPGWMHLYCKYVLPLFVLFIFTAGMIAQFG